MPRSSFNHHRLLYVPFIWAFICARMLSDYILFRSDDVDDDDDDDNDGILIFLLASLTLINVTMSNDGTVHLPQIIVQYNVTQTIVDTLRTTTISSSLLAEQIATTISPATTSRNISPAACFGFAILILATVGGNTLVLLALYLDKRLHSPSFYLIANMATADLLLGLSVLPFSSVLELLSRWIFGRGFCSAWLALDVLCCTASIMALMAISVDRYIGVTRPLIYSTIMTIRRTIYLIIVVWAVSILISVVPLFGLTDRVEPENINSTNGTRFEDCKVNKNTFYTIFSSMISFYIPVIILLILYSRVYQEAKKQGKKLEQDKRRLYQIDYQIAAVHAARRQQNESNGQSEQQQQRRDRRKSSSTQAPTSNPIPDGTINEVTSALLHHGNSIDEESSLDRTLTVTDGVRLNNDFHDLKNHPNDDTFYSGTSLAHHISHVGHSLGKRFSKPSVRTSQSDSHSHTPHLHHHHQHNNTDPMSPNDELQIIKRKLHNLKREQKAFRTLGLILGVLLICWLPFFVTLPVMSILKRYSPVNDENTWFKITFWLGYCNSAFNPFVYAFSNRAIRRAFRDVLFRRFCCCCLSCWLCKRWCPEKIDEYDRQQAAQRHRVCSGSLTTQTSQIPIRRTSSFSAEVVRTVPRTANGIDALSSSPIVPPRTISSGGPVVSFADFLAETGADDISSTDEKEFNHELRSSTAIPNNNVSITPTS